MIDLPLDILEKYEIKKVIHFNSFNIISKGEPFRCNWLKAGSTADDFLKVIKEMEK